MKQKKLKYSISNLDHLDNVKYHKTNELPALKIKTNNIEREVEVVLTTTVSDNKKLLNQFLARTQQAINSFIPWPI